MCAFHVGLIIMRSLGRKCRDRFADQVLRKVDTFLADLLWRTLPLGRIGRFEAQVSAVVFLMEQFEDFFPLDDPFARH